MVTIAASGFGLWLAARRKSEKFPYGLYKAETLAGLFIGALVLWAGVEMARDGIRQASSQQHRSGFSGPACHSDHSLNYYQLFPGKEGKRSRKIYQLPIPSNQGLRYPSGYLRLLCRVDRPASGLPGHSLRGRRPHHGNFSAYSETGGGNRLGLPPLAP